MIIFRDSASPDDRKNYTLTMSDELGPDNLGAVVDNKDSIVLVVAMLSQDLVSSWRSKIVGFTSSE